MTERRVKPAGRQCRQPNIGAVRVNRLFPPDGEVCYFLGFLYFLSAVTESNKERRQEGKEREAFLCKSSRILPPLGSPPSYCVPKQFPLILK